jgi:hypothetical protein
MNDLKTIVQDLAANMKRAATDLEAIPYQTRPSITNMVREAQEKVEKLKTEYFRRVRSNTLGIFLFGDSERVEAFTKIAVEEAGVTTLNGAELYERLADKIEPSLNGQREFAATQVQGLAEGLRDLAKTLDIKFLATPRLSDIELVPTREDLVRYIRKLVQSAVSDDLLRIYIDKKINGAAVDSLFSGNAFPVAITGLDPEEVSALAPLFTNSSTVEVGTSEDGEVNKEYVLKQLTTFKKKVKTKNN